MDAAPRVALCESCQEQRRALRWLQARRRAEVDAVLGVDLLGEFKDVDVFRLHQLLLDTGWREVDEITGDDEQAHGSW